MKAFRESLSAAFSPSVSRQNSRENSRESSRSSSKSSSRQASRPTSPFPLTTQFTPVPPLALPLTNDTRNDSADFSSYETETAMTRSARVFRISTVRRRRKQVLVEPLSPYSPQPTSSYSVQHQTPTSASTYLETHAASFASSSSSQSKSSESSFIRNNKQIQSTISNLATSVESSFSSLATTAHNATPQRRPSSADRRHSNSGLSGADRKLASLIGQPVDDDRFNEPSPSNSDLDFENIDLEDDDELEFRSSWNMFVNLSVVNYFQQRGIAPEFTLFGCIVFVFIFLRYWCTWSTAIRTSLYLFSFFRSFRALEKMSAYSGEHLIATADSTSTSTSSTDSNPQAQRLSSSPSLAHEHALRGQHAYSSINAVRNWLVYWSFTIVLTSLSTALSYIHINIVQLELFLISGWCACAYFGVMHLFYDLGASLLFVPVESKWKDLMDNGLSYFLELINEVKSYVLTSIAQSISGNHSNFQERSRRVSVR